jgi:hypothetical protein
MMLDMILPAFLLACGLLIVAVTWLGLRRLVGAPLFGVPGPNRWLILALDGLAPFAGFFLFLLPTLRPVLSGLAILALGVGMGVTDRVKRAVLNEPVVFADRAELIELVRHPRLYLAFVGIGRMILATAACLLLVAGLVWLEPELWNAGIFFFWPRVIIAALIGRLMFRLPSRSPLLDWLAHRYERLEPSRDPAVDAARFGLFATCIIQATLARYERPERQHAAQAKVWEPLPDVGPIVIVQGESFVDPRQLDPSFADLVPAFAQLQRDGLQHGRLSVPCWGANTIRSELAVLTGLGGRDIGLDSYNPYEHFARVPLPSLASAARAGGYRTICVHPYQPDFYYRDRVMPLLGFDEFIGIEGFADAARSGPYVSDVAVAERMAALIARYGPKVFVFAITMENHGPWDAVHDSIPPVPLPVEWKTTSDPIAIGRWLRHLASTDAMIPILRRAIGDRGVLAFYGDHQPSLSLPVSAWAPTDRRSDYAIWQAGGAGAAQVDLAAEDIASALMRAMRA